MVRKSIPTALLIFLTALTVHLVLINDYGLTWDFHHHFFAGAKFFGLSWDQVEPRPLPYTSPDPRGTYRLPYGPFVSIIPVASYLFFHVRTNLLPDDVAYNLPIVIVGSLGPALLFLFLSEALGDRKKALVAATFLFFTPRYFGDLHNNMKDIPMAVVFCLNVWLVWRLYTYRRARDLFAAATGFAIAFSTKVNSLFIPILFGVFLIMVYLREHGDRLLRHPIRIAAQSVKKYRTVLLYFLLAPVMAYLLWWFFWGDAIGQLKLMFTETFLVGTNNIEVLFAGTWYCSGVTVPWFYPYGYLAITTPLPMLVFFLIGIGIATARFLRKKDTTALLLVLWFFVPLTRYLAPRIGVIDGIRHFQEVVFPIMALAAIGLVDTITFFGKKIPHGRTVRLAVAGIFGFLVWQIIVYHPYQITYFNELVGGIRGAYGKYDLDYWGTSQKKAILWLNDHAPKGSTVNIVMAADVASRYLRADLLKNVNQLSYDAADYVVLLNRQSFFYRYYWIWKYMLRRKPAYIVENQGVPLVWIFDNKLGSFPQGKKWWSGESPCIDKYWAVKNP